MKFSATVIGLAAVATAVAAQGPPAPPSETGSATETCKEGEAKGPDGSCSPAAPVQTSAPSNTTTPTTPTTPATPTPIYPNLVTPVTGASSVGHPLAVPTAGVPAVHPVLGYGGFGAYPGLPHPYAGYMPHPAVLAAAAQGPSNSTNGLPQAAAAHAAAFGAYPGAYPLPLAHPAFGAYPGAYPLAHPAFGGYPFAHPAVAAAHAAAFGAYPFAHPAVAAAHVAAAHAAAFGAYPFAHPAFGAYPYPVYQPYGVSYQVVGSQLPHPNFPWNHPALKAQVAANNVGINAANAAHQAAHQAVFGVPSPFAIPQYSHNYGAYGQAHPQQA